MSNIKQEITDRLLNLPYSHRINNNQIAVRCAFCGDSKKDPTKTRFYIQTNINSDIPMLYNCFNCGVSGILTPQVLRTFEINDLTLNSQLISLNKSLSKNNHKKISIKDDRFNITVPVPLNTKQNLLKKVYIENRLGLSLSVKELVWLKTVFSLEQILNINNIESITCYENRAIKLNNDYVGFLTIDNGHIIYRDITNKNKLRYDKYSINPTYDNSKKFYTIPNKIDIVSNEPIYICIAEGIFDILGVYYHVKHKKLNNHIYIASCDSGFLNPLKYFISKGFIGNNIFIELYSDNDHDPYFYTKLYKELTPWVSSIKLFYNTKNKDFGVPKNDIDIIQKRMK